MSETSNQTSSFDAAIKACRRYLMEKGNLFDRGPSYEGNGSVLGNVKPTVRMYEGMGYTNLVELGDPPIYAVLTRGHREVHIFQPQDPKVREWLEHDEASLNDPALRAYILEKSGLIESDLPVADKPRHYHINEVDDVYIATTETTRQPIKDRHPTRRSPPMCATLIAPMLHTFRAVSIHAVSICRRAVQVRRTVTRAAVTLVLVITAGAGVVRADDTTMAGIAAYDALLQRYIVVSPDGVNRVDYGRWRASTVDRAALDGVIADKTAQKPSAMPRAAQFAYWANLYNAVTLKVILDAYPVASIRDIKSEGVWFDAKAYIGPWVTKRVTVEGKALSLDDIEHQIMRPTFADPRVHYSVNCASYGCPNLPPKAFNATTLEADLDAGARAFVNHPRGVTVKPDGTLEVSSIYHWFKADFGGTDAGVIAHLKQYAAPALRAKLDAATTVGSHAYDWSLNDTAKVKG